MHAIAASTPIRRKPHNCSTQPSTYASVSAKLCTLGGYMTGFFSPPANYIGIGMNALGFFSTHLFEKVEHIATQEKIENRKHILNGLSKRYGERVNVSPARGWDAYGLRNTWWEYAGLTVSTMANFASNGLFTFYHSNDRSEEFNGHRNAALILGAAAMLLHWIDHHYQRVNLEREKEVYDRAIEEMYESIVPRAAL
jgi:hypothetical protein